MGHHHNTTPLLNRGPLKPSVYDYRIGWVNREEINQEWLTHGVQTTHGDQQLGEMENSLKIHCNEVSSVTIQNHIPGQEINVALNPMYFKPIERPKITSTYTLDRGTAEICFCAIHNPNWDHTVHITAGNSSFQEIGHEISAGRKQENYVLRNNTQPWSLGDACSSQVKKSDLDPHSQGVLSHMYDVQQRQPLKLELKNRYRKIAMKMASQEKDEYNYFHIFVKEIVPPLEDTSIVRTLNCLAESYRTFKQIYRQSKRQGWHNI
jgi:hypothetical protein